MFLNNAHYNPKALIFRSVTREREQATDLERSLLSCLLVDALEDFAVHADPERASADGVVVRDRVFLGHQRSARCHVLRKVGRLGSVVVGHHEPARY